VSSSPEKSAIVALTLRKRLESLGRLEEIDQLLSEGAELEWVSKYIQTTLGLLSNIEPKVLAEALEDRRRSLVRTVNLQEVWPASQSMEEDTLGQRRARPPGKLSSIQYQRATRGMDLLLETESLYIAQRDRIDWLMGEEANTGIVNENMPREFQAANNTLVAYAKFWSEFGDTLGKMRKSMSVQGVEADTALGRKIADVLKNPESRHKVVSLFKRLAQATQLPPGEPTDGSG
jgi:hypothetical protein